MTPGLPQDKIDPRRCRCKHEDCPGHDRGGTIVVSSLAQRRLRCTECRRTFSADHDTLYFGLRASVRAKVVRIVDLYVHARPIREIATEAGVAPRTVQSIIRRARAHRHELQERLCRDLGLDAAAAGHYLELLDQQRPRGRRPDPERERRLVKKRAQLAFQY